MTQDNRNLERIGFQAYLGDLAKFLSGTKQMDTATAQLQKAQDRLADANKKVIDTQRQVDVANKRAEASTKRLTRVTEEQVAVLQTRLQRAQQRARGDTGASPEARLRNSQRIIDLERQIESAKVGAAERVAAVQASAANIAAVGESKLAAARERAARANRDHLQLGGQVEKQTRLGTAATNAFTRAQIAANTATQGFGRALIAMTGFSNRFAVALRFGAAAVVAFTTAMVFREASEFENALTKINNLTSLTTEQTKEMGAAILEMSKTIPKSPAELGAGAYEALSRGLTDVKQAAELTEIAGKASVAGFADIKDIVVAVTGIINAYGKENITATQATEILFATVKAGGGEFNDYAQNIGRVAQLGRDLGITFNQVGAAIATLTNVGIPANQATTALLGIMNQLSSPSREAEEALAKAGTSIQELRAQVRDKGLIPALQDLIRSFDGERQILEDLFPEVRGYSGALALLGTASTEFARTQETVNKSVGIVDEAFQQSSKTFSFQVGLIKNTLNRALINLGTAVLPVATRALQDLDRWIKRNEDSIIAIAKAGLQIFINTLKGALQIIQAIISVLSLLPAKEAAIVGAILAIGAAFAWALPGGPIIKGLLIISGILGTLSQEGGLGSKFASSVNKFFGINDKQTLDQGVLRQKVIETGSIEAAFRDAFKGVPKQFVDEIIKNFETKTGVDASKGIKEFDAALGKTGDTSDLVEQQMKELEAAFKDTAPASDELKEKLKELQEAFKASSEAAGQVESFTAKMGLFGEVSRELAEALAPAGASLQEIANIAGNIQGVDAVERALDRADNRAFNFAKTLATVAAAFERSASVANQIVRNLARSALEAAQAAAQSLFGRQTREVADLNVQLSRSQLSDAIREQSSNPRLASLQRQLDALNQQGQRNQRQQQISERNRQQSERARRQQADNQNNLAQQQLNQLKLTHLQQQIAFERMNDNLERQIAATQFQASEINKAFLQANEELQRQINEAIGRGDTGTALALTDQQQAAAKAYQSQADALRDNEQQLERQQRLLGFEERERQRQARLAEAAAEAAAAAVRSTENLTEAQDIQTDSVRESNDALEDQKNKIQEQIDAITSQNDLAGEQTQRIQDQIAVLEAQTAVQEALVAAADRTLLTQEQQAEAAGILAARISEASGNVVAFSESFLDFIPGFEESTEAFDLMREAIRVTADEGFRRTLIAQGIDPAAQRLSILAGTAQRQATATEKLTGVIQTSAGRIDTASRNILRSASAMISEARRQIVGGRSLGGSFGPAPNAQGGIYDRPTLIMVGETYQKELVLPLERPGRAKELLARLSPALVAPIIPNQQFITAEPQTSRIALIARDIDITDRKLVNLARTSDRLNNTFTRLSNVAGGAAGAVGTGAAGGSTTGAARIGTSANVGTGFIGAVGTGGTGTSSAAGIRPTNSTASMPVGTFSAAGTGGITFAPSISVQGETLETMRTVVNREVNRQFREATARSTRSGSLLTSGIGPSS